MEQPPRDPLESILERRHWIAIGLYGIVIAAAILGGFTIALEGLALDHEGAVTTAFLALSIARLLHAFNMRDASASAFSNEVTRNLFVWGAIAICIALLALAVYVPPLAEVLGLAPPRGMQWLVIATASILPLLGGQIYLAVRKAADQREGPQE